MMVLGENRSLDNAKSYLDFSGLEQLKRNSASHNPAQIKAVAQQFESIFVGMMLKNIRSANEALSKDNFLSTQQTQFYQEMLDQQLSVEVGRHQGIGLADMLVKQLTPKNALRHEVESMSNQSFNLGKESDL